MLKEPCFTVSDSPDAVTQSAATEPAYEFASTVSQPTVAIVDDDTDSLVLLENILDQFHCHTVCLSSGHAALTYLLQSPPDLILLDIWLPDVDGLDIAHVLRQNSTTQLIPIAAVTALASQRDRELILRAGCNHYISKPYLLEDVEAMLQQYLQLREA